MTNPSPSPQRVLILGASGSLGQGLVTRFLADDWAVDALSRSRPTTPEDINTLTRTQLDLSHDQAHTRLYAHICRTQPELIIHAAVTYGDRLQDSAAKNGSSLSRLETLFRVNSLAVFEALSLCYSDDTSDQKPHVIIINSDSMFHTTVETCRYAASKAALRVLTSGLSQMAKDTQASVATLLLGPLEDERKLAPIRRLAQERNIEVSALTAHYLSRSNPFLCVTDFIDLDACYQSVRYIQSLGPQANGMVCRLDGGSAGALI